MNNKRFLRYKRLIISRFWMNKSVKDLARKLTKEDVELFNNMLNIDWGYGIDGFSSRSTGFIEGYLVAKYDKADT